MLNYWWVTRPKRKLNSIPEVLSTFAEISLNEEWLGQRDTHLSLEDALEQAGLKRKGERRDQTGGGARTYKAWVQSLGLIFTHEATGQIKLTLAGEAIMSGESPVEVLKGQVLKYQFPSSFSLSRNINVAPRFKIRPFRFLLRLLNDKRINYLTEEEIAKIIVVEAEDESTECFEYIIERILQFRAIGDNCLDQEFQIKYGPSRGEGNNSNPYGHLMDLANTLVNWLEYTQLVKREERELRILPERANEVKGILAIVPSFIDRPQEQEYFQRKYGLDPKHRKDTRNLLETKTVTAKIIAEQKIKNAFVAESLRKPIAKIKSDIINTITEQTGIDTRLVEETLLKLYPHGAIGSFMAEYFEMAFSGRDNAVKFEEATVQIFSDVFGYKADHVGPIGLTPDVLIMSDSNGYQAIIDNKAYSKYSISNDHHNRMVHNYIRNIINYSPYECQLGFFSYIAGGFATNINQQIRDISSETSIDGSAISVSNIIKLVDYHNKKGYTHSDLRALFSLNRQILLEDI